MRRRSFAAVLSAAALSCSLVTPPLGGVAAGAAALPTNGHPRLAVVPHIPPPPQLAGCYRYTAVARWHTAACATAAFIQAHFPPPELLAGIGGAGRTVVRNAVKFTAGPLDVSVIAADPNGPVGSESDSSRGGDAYSLQSNEFFTGTNGLQDGVQFTDQSEPVPILGLLNGVCIWQIHAPFSQLANYTSNCATFGGSNPVHAVEGNVFGGLLTVAALTFSGTAGIAVVTPDLYGLGVGNNWNNSSGSILGYGGGSEAVFTNAEYYIALDVSSCLNDAGFIGYSVFCGPVGPLKHATFVTYAASPSTNGTNTVETNNLIPVIGPLPANLPKPLQYFYKGYTAQMAYFASTSGSCFVGRPPFCG